MKKKISQKKTLRPRRIKRPAGKKTASPKVSAPSPQVWGLHNLKPAAGSHKHRKILGRGSGSGHGKTSTRGSKGQTSRSGKHLYLGFEGGQSPLIRKIPKRGFSGRYKEYQIVNLEDLAKIKDKIITPALLEERGLIKDQENLIKILGDGEISEALTVSAHAFSKKAQDKIKNAGGTIEVLNA